MFNRSPALHLADNLRHKPDWPQAGLDDGRWVMARVEGYYSIQVRLRLAWGVFTGKYDALMWIKQ